MEVFNPGLLVNVVIATRLLSVPILIDNSKLGSTQQQKIC